MNVYDFDGTIYEGDSTRDFLLFCIFRHPAAFAYVPRAIMVLLLHALGLRSRDAAKGACLAVLRWVPNVPEECEAFWERHFGRVLPWYVERRRSDDVIVSASPSFLLKGACGRLGHSQLIATEVDFVTGKLLSPNCRGKEKVIRFRSELPTAKVDEFYSDSLEDEPMSRIAVRAYMVNHGQLSPWPKEGKT